MNQAESKQKVLPLAVPQDPDLALVLLLLRRMASGDLHRDEIAALGYQAFGRDYERPLTLIRAYLIETCTGATRRISMVGKDHGRMTYDEGRLIDTLVLALRDGEGARAHLRELTGREDVDAPLAAARLLAGALIEMGCPLGRA